MTSRNAVRVGIQATSRGRQLEREVTLYESDPDGRVSRFRYENEDVYLVWTSEHTTLDFLLEMWDELPDNISYLESEEWPAGFGDLAQHCMVSYFTHRKGGLPIGNKEVIFAAQKLRLLWRGVPSGTN